MRVFILLWSDRPYAAVTPETMGYNAIWAGLAYAPIGIMPLLISPLIGRYGNKIDMRLLVTFSFLMYAVCYYWRSVTFMPTIDFTGIILPQFFRDSPLPVSFLPLTTISFSGLPDNKFANASSMSNFFVPCQDQLVRR